MNNQTQDLPMTHIDACFDVFTPLDEYLALAPFFPAPQGWNQPTWTDVDKLGTFARDQGFFAAD